MGVEAPLVVDIGVTNGTCLFLVSGARKSAWKWGLSRSPELRAAPWPLRQGREMPGEGPGPKPQSGQIPGALDPSPGCPPSPCRSQGELGASCILLLPWCSTGLPACSGAQTCTDTGALVRLVGPLLKQEAAVRACVCTVMPVCSPVEVALRAGCWGRDKDGAWGMWPQVMVLGGRGHFQVQAQLADLQLGPWATSLGMGDGEGWGDRQGADQGPGGTRQGEGV